MSQFAAGCAICGYDLEAARRAATKPGPTISDRLAAARPRWLHSPTARQDAFVVALIFVLIVFFPLLALPELRFGILWTFTR